MLATHRHGFHAYYVTTPGHAPCLLNEAQVAPLKVLWQHCFSSIATEVTFCTRNDAHLYLICAEEKLALEQQIAVLRTYQYENAQAWMVQSDLAAEIQLIEQQIQVLAVLQARLLSPFAD